MRFRTVFSVLLAVCSTVSATAVARSSKRLPKGFATTNGGSFEIDGKPFAFVGANSYWLPLLTLDSDVEATFKQMQNAGVKVLRTWGFNAINATELPYSKESGLTYYQVWNSSEWQLNDGPQGLERLDHVIDVAGKHGIKVILAFTNNWVGYGGAELYINWIVGANATHDVFFTDPRINQSYQRYVKTIVNRYKSSPNIFAWELMNEARCLGDLPAGPNCPGKDLLSAWYKQQSDFVRSLDPFHMITTGGEGHFFWKNATGTFADDYNYNGQAGEDFDLDLTFPNLDFATYHLYPQSWYANLDFPGSDWNVEDWGLEWISQHAAAAKKANKPVILEEFGLIGIDNKTNVYPSWVNRALDTRHGGIMPWQFGALGLKEPDHTFKYADIILDGASPNDGYAIFKNMTDVWNIFTKAAKVQASRSG